MWKLLCMLVILSITLSSSNVEGKAIGQPEMRPDPAGLNQENSIDPSKGLIERLRRSPEPEPESCRPPSGRCCVHPIVHPIRGCCSIWGYWTHDGYCVRWL